MENNQEHKIDKIFKQSLENQSVIPPSDAWTAIHTYTIGQEETKKKDWFRYASLMILFFLFLSSGFWYFVDNQKHTSVFLTQKVVSEDTDHGGGSSVSTQTTAQDHSEKLSARTKTTAFEDAGRAKLSNHLAYIGENSLNRKTNGQTQDFNFQEVVVHTPIIENQALTVEDNLTNKKNEIAEPVSYLTENNLEIIESKPLIVNDLIDEIQKRNENNIVALEKNIFDKKEVFKVDSINYGSKFSLKHPIITLGIFGTGWNFWNFDEEQIGKTFYPNKRISTVKVGVAWKINSKFRVGLSLGTSYCDLGVPIVNVLPQSSYIAGVNAKLIQINSDQYYQADTPFGGVKIPTSQFKDLPFRNPNVLDSTIKLTYYGILPHSMQITTFSINSQFDLLSMQRKNRKKYSYQIYGLLDFNVQRQSRYYFNASIPYLTLINGQYENRSLQIYAEGNHLQNASEFIFSLRTGLGFRYQFGRKWDFYVEGSGQHSLNNWVKNSDVKIFQRTLSLQAGINLNL
jgi:hypothetical protein